LMNPRFRKELGVLFVVPIVLALIIFEDRRISERGGDLGLAESDCSPSSKCPAAVGLRLIKLIGWLSAAEPRFKIA
jgi:hypothetical protein